MRDEKKLSAETPSPRDEDKDNIPTLIKQVVGDDFIAAVASTFNEPEADGMLIVKPANQWMEEAATRPIPRDLFYGLVYEGDLTLLFAGYGAGKSTLALQFAHENSLKEKVLYLDCELSDKQFQTRYTAEKSGLFRFNDNLLRAELNPSVELPAGMTEEDFLIESIEQHIKTSGIRILILDNLTYLRNDTEKAREALSLMKRLKRLKQQHGISILAITHCPKRDDSRPLSRNDMAGSMMLSNLADGIFAIGQSPTDKSLRYIKQFKCRYTEIQYDSDNVIVYQMNKRPDGFLEFEHMGYGNEADYIRIVSDKKELEQQIRGLRACDKSFGEIAKELNITRSKVQRVLEKTPIQ